MMTMLKQVIGLVVGHNFTTPVNEVLEKHWELHLEL